MQTLGIRRLFVALAFAAFWALTPGGAEAALPPSVGGQWQNGPNLPYFPPHMHLLPDGQVMMWPGDGGVSGDDPRVWNPVSGTLTTLGKAGFDVFCTGHTFLPDGRLFVAGGHIGIAVGLPEAAIYNRANNTWARQPRMNLGRWYPTVTLLPNGDVLVVSGSVDTSTGNNSLPQVWQTATGTWRSLTSAELALPLYPYMFLAPNGAVFNAGPGVTTRYLNTDGTGAWSVVGDRTHGAVRDYGSAVMYEPGKVLIVGGGDPPTNTAEVIDLNAASPKWRAVSPMSTARRQMNATVLPDGKVLVTGGTRGAGYNNADPGNPVLAAELWNPATESWTVMESDTLPRLYHAVAMLLPDARVLMTGGNGYTQSTIFSPPYLFTGSPRPTITSAPATVAKGQSFLVGTPDTGINMVAWVGLPSVTHTNNMSGAIFRSTAITQASGGINIVAPNNTSVPAGHYMLFVLRNGVPSVARIVQLGAGTALPAPTMTSMTPNSAVAGSAGFTLNVTGSNFLAGSTLRWNGSNRTTTFISETQLSAAIPASDIAATGTAQVTVVNPSPGGGTSSPLAFTVTSSGSTWVKVGDEGSTFTVSGTQRVRFGKGTSWIEKMLSGTVECTRFFFGADPAPGVFKQCEVFTASTSGTWVKAGDEGATFTVTGTQRVRFGKGTAWIEKMLSGTVECTRFFFGADPAPGVVKQCDVFTATWTSGTWVKAGDEGATFTVTGTQRVRFGKGTAWIEKMLSGTVECTRFFFGADPAPGVVKQCDVLTATTATAPGPQSAIGMFAQSGAHP